MDTKQLMQICRGDDEICRSFLGVFPADMIPRKITYPCSFIANTEPKTHPGRHWIAVYVDCEGYGTHFCSYGSKTFSTAMNRLCVDWQANEKRLQSFVSAACGQYCVSFLHFANQNVSLREFLALFSDDRMENDEIVVAFVNGLYNEDTSVLDVEFIVNQLSTQSV